MGGIAADMIDKIVKKVRNEPPRRSILSKMEQK